MPAADLYEELYDRIDKTSASRFNANIRLLRHHGWSQWTNVLVSVSLVAIPLAQAYRLPLAESEDVANFSQVFLAVAILALTIQFGTSNFGTRAEKFLDCGKELQGLMHRVSKLRGQQPDKRYDDLVSEYEGILAGYENHAPVDFRFMQIKKSAYYKKGRAFVVWTWVQYSFAFVPYVLVILVVAGWSLWLLAPVFAV